MSDAVVIVGLIYAATNIGLLCSIKFDMGRGSQRLDDHDRRLEKVEGKLA
ncbi:hypothetical protein [Kordiimonas sp.]